MNRIRSATMRSLSSRVLSTSKSETTGCTGGLWIPYTWNRRRKERAFDEIASDCLRPHAGPHPQRSGRRARLPTGPRQSLHGQRVEGHGHAGAAGAVGERRGAAGASEQPGPPAAGTIGAPRAGGGRAGSRRSAAQCRGHARQPSAGHQPRGLWLPGQAVDRGTVQHPRCTRLRLPAGDRPVRDERRAGVGAEPAGGEVWRQDRARPRGPRRGEPVPRGGRHEQPRGDDPGPAGDGRRALRAGAGLEGGGDSRGHRRAAFPGTAPDRAPARHRGRERFRKGQAAAGARDRPAAGPGVHVVRQDPVRAAAGARSRRGGGREQSRNHAGAGGRRLGVGTVHLRALQPQPGQGVAGARAGHRGIGRHELSRRSAVMPEERVETGETKEDTGNGNGTRWRIGGVAALVLILIAGIVWWRSRGKESTDDAQVDGHITQIAARVGGTVTRVPVANNQAVKAGDILVEIDPRDYQIAVERAKAELADAVPTPSAARTGVPLARGETPAGVSTASGGGQQAEATVAGADRGIQAPRANLVSAQAPPREKEATATPAARDVERLRGLVQKDEIPQQQFDAAVAASDSARAAADAAKSEVSAAQGAIAVAEQRAASARGAASQAQAGLANARTAPQQLQGTEAHATSADAHLRQAEAVLQQAEANLE